MAQRDSNPGYQGTIYAVLSPLCFGGGQNNQLPYFEWKTNDCIAKNKCYRAETAG